MLRDALRETKRVREALSESNGRATGAGTKQVSPWTDPSSTGGSAFLDEVGSDDSYSLCAHSLQPSPDARVPGKDGSGRRGRLPAPWLNFLDTAGAEEVFTSCRWASGVMRGQVASIRAELAEARGREQAGLEELRAWKLKAQALESQHNVQQVELEELRRWKLKAEAERLAGERQLREDLAGEQQLREAALEDAGAWKRRAEGLEAECAQKEATNNELDKKYSDLLELWLRA
jgi:hypothetical protein